MDNRTPMDVTELLRRLGEGDSSAMDELTPVVYDELRALAHRARRGGRPSDTLHTTALANEAWLKLVDQTRARWQSRAHFFGVAAKAMRSILVDHARARQAAKRGGDRQRIPLDDALASFDERRLDVLDLDGALTRLAEMDERKSRVVELRFFGGLSIEETAEALGVSHATVERDWDFARTWLFRELQRDEGESPSIP